MAGLEERLWRHLKKLTVEIGERSVERPGALSRAGEYIGDQLAGSGYHIIRQKYVAWGRERANIVARSEGSGSRCAVVVGAHYDTVAGSPGADDNGSAVAVMLETARIVAGDSFLRPVEFVGFALEEPPAFASPAQGSRVYARRAREKGRRIEGMICLEMVGYCTQEPKSQQFPPGVRRSRYPDKGNFLAIVANSRSRRLMNDCLQAYRDASGIPAFTLCVPAVLGRFIGGVDLSDHASFWREGYPAVMFTDTSFYRNPHYHSPSDRIETLDIAFMAGVVRGLAEALRRLAVSAGGSHTRSGDSPSL